MALMSVEEARRLVLSDVAPLGVERVSLAAAGGRVLAQDLIARRSQPAADMSAMDGYAVKAEDITDTPARLRVIGESAAGRPFAGQVERGEAVRIFTGAVVPEGADTVVIQENVARDGDIMVTTAPTAPLKNIRKAGFDIAEGAILLTGGRRLTGRDLMMASAMNHGEVAVYRRPRVGLLQTGDELVRPGLANDPSHVVVSNVYGLSRVIAQAGGEPLDLGLVPDDLDATRAAIRAAADGGIDILVTSGGASVGDHDLVVPALRAEGVSLSVHKIAFRPGKPLMYGTRGPLRLLGLPGNPVSAYVCALVFLKPLIFGLLGDTGDPLSLTPAILGRDVPANDVRMDFMRAVSEIGPDGARRVTPFPVQDSSMLSALAEADCLLVRLPDAPEGKAGEPCQILRLMD